jgi:hypothetical protein
MREGIMVGRTPRREGSFARLAPVVIRRKHRGMAQREDVLEHRFVGLRRAHALPPCIEPSPQLAAMMFRPFQPLSEHLALAETLIQFGAEPPPAGQMPDEITKEASEPGH